MSQNQQQPGGKVSEHQTLEVPITTDRRADGVAIIQTRRTDIEYDVSGVPYSSPAVQSNFTFRPDTNETSVFPGYYVNSNLNPGSQQTPQWQGVNAYPDIVVLPSTQYLTQREHKVADHLCWSIFVMLFCCFPLGVFAIAQSGAARRLAEQGYIAEATSKANSAKTFIVASVIIGILIYCISGTSWFYRFNTH